MWSGSGGGTPGPPASHHGQLGGARKSLSPGAVLGGWLRHSPSVRWGQQGAAPGLRLGLFAQGVAGVSLVGPSCRFPARLPQPDGSNPVPFFLLPLYFGPGGGRQRWRVEFHFFPLFSLLAWEWGKAESSLGSEVEGLCDSSSLRLIPFIAGKQSGSSGPFPSGLKPEAVFQNFAQRLDSE